MAIGQRPYRVVALSGSMHPRFAGAFWAVVLFGIPLAGSAVGYPEAAVALTIFAGLGGIAWLYVSDRRAIDRLERLGEPTTVTIVKLQPYGDGNVEVQFTYGTRDGNHTGAYSPGRIPWRGGPLGEASREEPAPGDQFPAVYDPGHPDLIGWLGPSWQRSETPPATAADTAALAVFAILVATCLGILVIKAFNDPGLYGIATPVLFVGFGITGFLALPALNGFSWWGGRPGPFDRAAAVVMVETFVAFALMTLSPLNH
jgi:hypothetical protein